MNPHESVSHSAREESNILSLGSTYSTESELGPRRMKLLEADEISSGLVLSRRTGSYAVLITGPCLDKVMFPYRVNFVAFIKFRDLTAELT